MCGVGPDLHLPIRHSVADSVACQCHSHGHAYSTGRVHDISGAVLLVQYGGHGPLPVFCDVFWSHTGYRRACVPACLLVGLRACLLALIGTTVSQLRVSVLVDALECRQHATRFSATLLPGSKLCAILTGVVLFLS